MATGSPESLCRRCYADLYTEMRLRLKSHHQRFYKSFVWENNLLREEEQLDTDEDTEYALLTLYRNKQISKQFKLKNPVFFPLKTPQNNVWQ